MYDPECNLPACATEGDIEELRNYYENELRNKDEKIMSLEAENAVLHLRMAKLTHQLQIQAEKIALLSSRIQEQLKERRQWKGSVFSLYTKFLALQDEYEILRNCVSILPSQLQQQCASVVEMAAGRSGLLHEMTADVEALQHQLMEKDKLLGEISEQLSKEKHKRKMLHNTIMELRGNIRVHCRVRPVTNADQSLDSDPSSLDLVIQVIDEETVGVSCNKNNRMFEFERVHFPNDNQEAVFHDVQMLITSLFDGYNVCVMAYGQTGSGKTHTMLGDYGDLAAKGCSGEGVIPRAIREIFQLISLRPSGIHSLELSIIEIYNNEIRDLLSSESKTKNEVVMATDGSMCLPTVTCRVMRSEQEMMDLVQQGLSARCQTATQINEHSSRSHLLVIVTLTTKVTTAADQQVDDGSKAKPQGKKIRSQIPRFASRSTQLNVSGEESQKPNTETLVKTKLQLIDLAGSECVGVSGVTGKHLRESLHINRSLCALADVLTALAEGRSHIPYRNSRLTHLLQDSIGGDAKLLILLCISPMRCTITESLQSLQFGQRARQVQRGQIRRRSLSAPNSFFTSVMMNTRDSGLLSPRPVRSRSASLRALAGELQI